MPDRVLAETGYLRLIDRDGWSFVERPNVSGVVTMVAITDDQQMLFVEQMRKPLGQTCIELPAGLAGDESEFADEPLTDAARRELLEETGYLAESVELLVEGATSPGMTDEVIGFYLCTGLKKQHEGGGVEGENITVHEVPLKDAGAWLVGKQRAGGAVAAKAFAGIYFALAHGARTATTEG